MGLESVAYGTALNTANPPNTDQRKQGDDHLRLIKTAVKQSLQLMGGGLTTAGTSTVLTVTTGHVNSPTYQDGHLYAFGLHTDIGVSATVDFDAIGARTIKKMSPTGWIDVAAGDYKTGHVLLCYYEAGDTTMRIVGGGAFLSTASGGTVVGEIALQSDDAGATQGPSFHAWRNSASPAVNDVIGGLVLEGNSSTGVKRTYANIFSQILDPTNGSEDSQVVVQTLVGGGPLTLLTIAQPITVVAAGLATTSTNGVFPGNNSNFFYQFDGTNPIEQMDSGDDRYYDRAANAFVWRIASASVATISAALGVSARNTPIVAVSFDFPAGVPTVARSVNVSSLTDNGTGDVTVVPIVAVANAELIQLAGACNLVAATALHVTARNLDRTQTTTALQLACVRSDTAALTDIVRGSVAWLNGA